MSKRLYVPSKQRQPTARTAKKAGKKPKPMPRAKKWRMAKGDIFSE